MQFTYDAYRKLLILLQSHRYEYANYYDWQKYSRCVILRHDLDFDISRALEIARIEESVKARSTYFILVHSDAYNALSFQNVKILREILHYGHDIGLHFDETNYPECVEDRERIIEFITDEAAVLGRAIGTVISSVSMHRPSTKVLEADLKIPGMVNSYGRTFFHHFKYLSDSRRHWREPVERIIESELCNQLQILMHPFWYSAQEQDLETALIDYVNHANYERFLMLKDNFTNLDEVLNVKDIAGMSRENGTLGEKFVS